MRLLRFMLPCLVVFSCTPKTKKEAFLDQLMSQMTLEEKVGQLNLPSVGDVSTGELASTDISKKIRSGQVGGLFNMTSLQKIHGLQKLAVEQSRLKIPLIFAMDVIHGYRTIFPIPLALSCAWNMEAVEQVARISAQEATAEGIAWTFSPMTDISRDPRWGRVSEGAGEDPYLGAQIAAAMVKGYQQNDLGKPNTLMACLKHFALYGAAEAGRDYNTTDMSRVKMFNQFFPPYKAAVDAGAATVMTSFNEVDGIPASANKWLMTDVLREKWGFEGFVVTDYTAINEMVAHGLGELKGVSKLALQAGVDMDMVGQGFLDYIPQLVKEGKLQEVQVDKACRRILSAKYDLGLFENPYQYGDADRTSKEVFSQEHRAISRKIATESFVLLKNKNSLLPLSKKQKVALIGPMGNNKENMVGTWCVTAKPELSISVMEGMQQVVGKKASYIQYARGANFVADAAYEERFSIFGKPTYRDKRTEQELINEAIQVARKAEVIVLAIGEAAEMSGESSSRSEIIIPLSQRKLMQALKKLGKPMVGLVFSGRPLDLRWENEHLDAMLQVWFPGSEGGLSIADVLYGDVVPSGKLTQTFPQNVGQIPIYYNSKKTGRPLPKGAWFQKFRSNYLDVSNEPLFPFGYGLSYTQFSYSNLKLEASNISQQDKLRFSVELTNTGKYTAKEVVQVYIHDKFASITRPVKELKAFKKVELKPQESRTISFELAMEALSFYNANYEQVVESGDFEIFVGGSSQDCISKSFTLN